MLACDVWHTLHWSFVGPTVVYRHKIARIRPVIMPYHMNHWWNKWYWAISSRNWALYWILVNLMIIKNTLKQTMYVLTVILLWSGIMLYWRSTSIGICGTDSGLSQVCVSLSQSDIIPILKSNDPPTKQLETMCTLLFDLFFKVYVTLFTHQMINVITGQKQVHSIYCILTSPFAVYSVLKTGYMCWLAC